VSGQLAHKSWKLPKTIVVIGVQFFISGSLLSLPPLLPIIYVPNHFLELFSQLLIITAGATIADIATTGVKAAATFATNNAILLILLSPF
jgi:hypothetical protein